VYNTGMIKTKQITTVLTPRQSSFMELYTDRSSTSFGNAYQSAIAAGYSDQFARNITHLKPEWLSDNIGQMVRIIEPDDIMKKLTVIINSDTEPTIVRLKAIEMTMKAYSMMVQRQERNPEVVTLNIDLTGSTGN
jgi:phage terminase small subunit